MNKVKESKSEYLKESRLIFSNRLIRIKFELKKIYLLLDEYSEQIRAMGRASENKHVITFPQSENYIKELRKQENKKILLYGEELFKDILPIISELFSEEEIIQLISGSKETHKEYKETMKLLEKGNCPEYTIGGFAFNYVYYHGEYRWKRGRAKDFIDCPRWEMPLFHSICEYTIFRITSNPDLNNKVGNKIKDMFEDAMYYASVDPYGNIINVEKASREITIRELLLEYRDYKNNKCISLLKPNVFLSLGDIVKIRKISNTENIYMLCNDHGVQLGLIQKK